MTAQEQKLIEVGTLLAQELAEIVGDAQQASGDDNALAGTQALISDWEAAYRDCNFFGEPKNDDK